MILNTMQLSRSLGCSDSAISDAVKKGMPRLRAGRRGKPSLFDFDAVAAWCQKTGFATRIDVLARAAPPAAGNEKVSAVSQFQIARAIALARVEAIGDMPGWEYEARPSELVDFLDVYLVLLASQLAKAGLAEVREILDDCHTTTDPLPDDIEQLLARARAEVPQP